MSEEREEVKQGLAKKSFRPLYPVLIEKGTWNILDGRTRKQADPLWHQQEIEITDPKDRVLIPVHANYRRKVPMKETASQLISLADILEEEGVPRDQIVAKVTELTPFTEQYVRKLLPAKYKMTQMARLPRKIAKLVSQTQTPTQELTAPLVTTPPLPKSELPTCPFCHSELKTFVCPRCYRVFEMKKIRRE